MDETDFRDTTMNLISESFREHEGEEDMTPSVLRKADLRTTFARESSSTRTQLFETPTTSVNGPSEDMHQLKTPQSVYLCTYSQAHILKVGELV